MDAPGVTFIDIDRLSRTRGPLALTGTGFRAVCIGFGLFVLSLLWMMGVLIAFGRLPDAALIVTLPLAFGPFVLLIFGGLGLLARWNAGVGMLAGPRDFTEAQLATTVDPFSVTLRELLARVAAFATAQGKAVVPVTTDPALLRRSFRTRIAAFALIIGGVVVSAAASNGQPNPNAWPAIIAMIAGMGALLESRRVLQLDANALLAADRRKLILLLRSFRDEKLMSYQLARTPLGDISVARRFEQGVAGALGAFGPLVAIGKPGDQLPQIGAARTYLTSDEWRPAVIRWMNEALMIAMIAGATEWIRWELRQILELGHVRRLVILLPLPYDAARWTNVVDGLAGTRWEPLLRTLDPKNVILLQLRPDGGILAIRKSASRVLQDDQLALAIAIYEEFCRQSPTETGTRL